MKIKAVEKKLTYLEVLLIILQSGTVQSALNAESALFRVSQVIMIAIALYFAIRGLNNVGSRYFKLGACLMFIGELLAIISLIKYPGSFMTLEYKFFLFLMYCFMVYYIQRIYGNLIEEATYNTILSIAVMTLTIYMITGLAKIELPHMYVTYPHATYAYKTYFYLFYTYSYQTIPRISGLFWEPGVYQIYLNLALLLYVVQKKGKKWQLFVLMLSIAFTQSAMGYIITATIIAMWIISSRKFKKETHYIVGMIMTVIALLFVGCVYAYKKETTNIAGDSYFLRIRDLAAAWKVFLGAPVFGVGFYNWEPFEKVIGYVRGNSAGLLTWLYMTGICGMTFAFYPFCVNLYGKKKREKLIQIAWIICFILFNAVEPIYNLPIIAAMVAREYSRTVPIKRRCMRLGKTLKTGYS